MEALAFENFVERVLSESLSGVHSVIADRYASLRELSIQTGDPAYPLALDEMLDFVKSMLKVFAFIHAGDERIRAEVNECMLTLDGLHSFDCLEVVKNRLSVVL